MSQKLKDFEKSILDKAEAKGQKRLEQAQSQHEADFNERVVKLEKEWAKKLDQSTKQLKKTYQEEIRDIKKQISMGDLKIKRDVINQLCQEAIERMNSWEEEKHLSFFEQVIAKYHDNNFVIRFGEYSYQALSDSSKEYLMSKYPQHIFLAEHINGKGGFILTQEGVDRNYLYDRLIEVTGPDLAMDLNEKLFNQ